MDQKLDHMLDRELLDNTYITHARLEQQIRHMLAQEQETHGLTPHAPLEEYYRLQETRAKCAKLELSTQERRAKHVQLENTQQAQGIQHALHAQLGRRALELVTQHATYAQQEHTKHKLDRQDVLRVSPGDTQMLHKRHQTYAKTVTLGNTTLEQETTNVTHVEQEHTKRCPRKQDALRAQNIHTQRRQDKTRLRRA